MPPNWQVASLNDGPLDNEPCIYGVDFFPPGAQVDLTKAGQIHEAWLVKIDVDLTCPLWQSSDDHWLTPEAQPILVSGVTATGYDDEDKHFVVERVIVAMFGGYQFRFMVHSYQSPDETKQVYALFDQMLHGFQYKGS